MSPALVFAAGDAELIRVIIVVVIFVIAAIAQLLAKLRQAAPPANRPRPVPTDVAEEIAEFMRRAAQRRNGGAEPASPPPASAAPEPVPAEVVAPHPIGRRVGQHVQEYLDADDFARRGEQLGADVVQTVNKEIDQHLHQVFDHTVSKLEAVPGETATPPSAYEPPNLVGTAADIPASFATGLLDLLSNPDSLRQAIILNEILQRRAVGIMPEIAESREHPT